MTQFNIGECCVTMARDEHAPFTHTAFPDGTFCLARPGDGEPADVPPVHDLLHALIAQARGESHSKALWNVAHPDMPQYHPAEVAEEEARVLRFQAVIEQVLGGTT